ncbi:MAG: serine/threonine protein kinase [Methylibium sp.]|nr:serine/threonine protein kinase [Methylibium sp.]
MPTIGQIGRYALKYRIGAGGLGTVYAADDPLLSRRVAIKTLNLMPAGSSTPLETAGREPFNEMFLHEARASAQLSHPHIVTVFDAGISPQGAYITMELLKGKDLRELLAEGWRPSAGQAALIIRRAADALAYAHSKGVVHRDVKPANIFMVGRTQPKVLDFGIASIAHAADSGAAGGSPHYMAPEQMRSEATDRRTDVFSLGVVLYELLCGRRAFDGDSLEAITRAVREHQPPAARTVAPAVPQALSDIAARAMSKRPEDRQRSARVLARELHEWLQATPEVLHSDEDDGLPVARGRTRAGLLAAALCGAALVGVGLWYAMAAPPDRPGLAAGKSTSPPGSGPARSTAMSAKPATALTPPAEEIESAPAAPAALANATAADGLAASATASTAATNEPAEGLAAAGTTVQPTATPAEGAATGILQLAVSPWAEVEIDGRVVGITPPLRQLSLTPGRHTVRLRNGAFAPHVRTIEVGGDETATIRHRFGP